MAGDWPRASEWLASGQPGGITVAGMPDAATRYDADRKALIQASDLSGVGDKAFATQQQGLLAEFLKGTKVGHCGGAGSSSTFSLAGLEKVLKAYADKLAP